MSIYDSSSELKLLDLSVAGNLPKDLTDEQRGEMRALADLLAHQYEKNINSLVRSAKSERDESSAWRKEIITSMEEWSRRGASDDDVQRVLDEPASRLSWYTMQDIVERDPGETIQIWRAIIAIARESIASGSWAAKASCADSEPLARAEFKVLHDGFHHAWKPRDVIEASMVDMLAQSFYGFNRWLSAANTMGLREYEAAKRLKDEDDKWNTPRLDASDAIDKAFQMADRCHRLYMRTLRQMRDLRRYQMPVTINNPKQVNIAADGGQQVNVQAKRGVNKKPRSTRQKHIIEG